MKKHTAQWLMVAIGILFTGLVMAQGDYDRYDRDEKRKGSKGYHNRSRDRHNDYNAHSYHDHRGRYRDDDYPVVRYKPRQTYHDFRGNRPSPRHVWMPGEYRWRNGGYVYHSGYWIMPPRPGMHYVPGYWQPARNGGYVWISGFWSGGGISIRW
jgi:WXXGXW repeat (2 copies)